MLKSYNNTSRQARFESLENRNMMAGNVTTAVVGGILALGGDNSSNYLVVHQIGTNRIQVQGIATTIRVNGQSYNSYTFNNVTGLLAELGGGNDTLTMYDTTLNSGIDALLESGNDVLNFTNIKAVGGVAIDAGSGNDAVALSRITANNGVAVQMRSGNDALAMATVNANDGVAVSLGDGNDVASFVSITAASGFALDAGNGRDAVVLNRVNAPAGIAVDMGTGDFDTLSVAFCTASEAGFNDSGSNGLLTRVGNQFGSQTVSGFRWVV
jgi:hypothetical protein